MVRIGHLDCFSGAAGDMLIGACLDAGASLVELREQLSKLPLGGYELRAEKVRRQSLAGTHFVVVAGTESSHRHLAEIDTMIRQAGFSAVREARMLEVFRVLAEAEARVHGTSVESVHFHEVGAVDAIVDVCGTVIALDLLGIEQLYASEIVVGTGVVDCAHGQMPVPAPGTLALLEGLPVRSGVLHGERCTPTGAALLRVLVDEFCVPLSWRPLRVGYGAGTRDEPPVPNLLRLTVGEVDDERGVDQVWELSLQVDNVSGEVLGAALQSVMEAGALDVWTVATLSKKSRPAHWVVALCDEATRPAIERCLLSELPTLGLRRRRSERVTLPRRVETRETDLGRVRFKVRTLPDGTEVAHAEADDVARLAREHGLAIPVVLARIASAGRSAE